MPGKTRVTMKRIAIPLALGQLVAVSAAGSLQARRRAGHLLDSVIWAQRAQATARRAPQIKRSQPAHHATTRILVPSTTIAEVVPVLAQRLPARAISAIPEAATTHRAAPSRR